MSTSDQRVLNGAAAAQPATPPRAAGVRPWLEWAVPAACCLVLLAQMLWSVRQVSQTADESTHLYAGYRYLKCGDTGFSPEHPPLAKIVAAAPLLAENFSVDCRTPTQDEARASLRWLYSNDWQSGLARARAAISVFALALCLLVWIVARRMFGIGAAVIATVLLAFDPNLIAHGALVTTDTVVAFTLFFAVYAFYLWMSNRSPAWLLLAGVAAGLTLVAKHSGVIIGPILILLAVAEARLAEPERRSRWRRAVRNLLATALIGAIAFGVLWGVYRFRYAARPDGTALPSPDADRGTFAGALVEMKAYRVLPEAYLEGLQRARVLARGSQLSMLFGHIYKRGPWYFFPALLLIKSTIAVLLLTLLGMAGARLVWKRHRRELWFIALPGGVFLLAAMAARMHSGIRHILPVLPFLLIFAAAGCMELARRARWVIYVVACAAALHAASSLHAFPDYLSYANEFWGGPRNTYKYVPNNDWGQGLKELKTYLDRHPGEPCWFASPYWMDIQPYGIPCRQFLGGHAEPIPPQVRGVVVLSNVLISDTTIPWLATFAHATPTTQLAGSALLVYEGDFDTHLTAGETERFASIHAMSASNFPEALRHARRAVELVPDNKNAHWQYCQALVANQAVDSARWECELAWGLAEEDTSNAQTVAAVSEAVTARQLRQQGKLQEAVQYARRAVDQLPDNSMVRSEYCEALAAAQQPGLAEKACSRARRLVLEHRSRDPRLEPTFGWDQTLQAMLYALGESP